MFDNVSFLFGDWRIATAGSGKSQFAHTFGGPHDRSGASRDECNGILLHLLHRFDLRDPAIPIRLPRLRWLPLYYVFDFRANDVAYRLTSDDSITTFFPADDPNVSENESWPTKDYPPEFPQTDISVSPYQYDPKDLDDAYRWAGIFGISKLSATNQALAKRRVDELIESLGEAELETEEDYDSCLSNPFAQGKPMNDCLNPDCKNNGSYGTLDVIALVSPQPVAGVTLWGGAGVQLIFEICPECQTVRGSNQSS